jgi:tetratricopeptide (TPR) repeat protein
MKINKSQQLWYLLNRFDREESETNTLLLKDLENYPFFYLLNWNFDQGKQILRKTALQSPIRKQFYQVQFDAPEITFNNAIDNNQQDIIEEFLQKMPTLAKAKKQSTQDELQEEVDLAASTWTPPVSETFAIILVKQQKYQQAIDIYEQLILAKPEKRLYFATRISELKQNINE